MPMKTSSAVLAQGSLRFVDGSQGVFSVASFPTCPPELLDPGFRVSLKGEGHAVGFFCGDCSLLALSQGFLPAATTLVQLFRWWLPFFFPTQTQIRLLK